MLCAVDHIDNFNSIRPLKNSVDYDERQRRQRQFTRAFNSPASALMRKPSELSGTIVNRPRDATGGIRIVFTDIINNTFEVLGSSGGPADLHLGLQHPFEPVADFLVGEELPAVELLQAVRHFLTEPHIVI
jgi:hypothetical protein